MLLVTEVKQFQTQGWVQAENSLNTDFSPHDTFLHRLCSLFQDAQRWMGLDEKNKRQKTHPKPCITNQGPAIAKLPCTRDSCFQERAVQTPPITHWRQGDGGKRGFHPASSPAPSHKSTLASSHWFLNFAFKFLWVNTVPAWHPCNTYEIWEVMPM